VFDLLKQIDGIADPNPGTLPVFEHLRKTSLILNERVSIMVKESYGFNGITFNNIE
jgi:hypothetical protein